MTEGHGAGAGLDLGIAAARLPMRQDIRFVCGRFCGLVASLLGMMVSIGGLCPSPAEYVCRQLNKDVGIVLMKGGYNLRLGIFRHNIQHATVSRASSCVIPVHHASLPDKPLRDIHCANRCSFTMRFLDLGLLPLSLLTCAAVVTLDTGWTC